MLAFRKAFPHLIWMRKTLICARAAKAHVMNAFWYPIFVTQGVTL